MNLTSWFFTQELSLCNHSSNQCVFSPSYLHVCCCVSTLSLSVRTLAQANLNWTDGSNSNITFSTKYKQTQLPVPCCNVSTAYVYYVLYLQFVTRPGLIMCVWKIFLFPFHFTLTINISCMDRKWPELALLLHCCLMLIAHSPPRLPGQVQRLFRPWRIFWLFGFEAPLTFEIKTFEFEAMVWRPSDFRNS